MFQTTWDRRLLFSACSLCVGFWSPTAHAGSIGPSQLQGDYANTNLGTQVEQFPVSFSLTNGIINNPSPLSGFTASDLNASIINPASPLNLGTDLILDGGASGTIDYHIVTSSNSPILATATLITSELTLVSNTTSVSLVNLNPAVIRLFFPAADVEFDPRWSGFSGPVDFTIDPIPEPASIVHLTWVGVLGVLDYWRRHRRGASVRAA